MKYVLAILFLAAPAFGAVTSAQVDQAKACSEAVFDCSVNLRRYAVTVKTYFDNNFTLAVAGSTNTVALPQSVQDDVINVQKYQSLKSACTSAFAQCP